MVAITTLMNERAGLGASAALGLANALDELIELAKERGRADDPIVRDKVARLKIGIEGLRLGRDAGADGHDEGRHPRPRGLDREAAVVVHQPGPDRACASRSAASMRCGRTRPWAYRFLRSRANSIEGGTSDVLRNIVAERVLGLPKLQVMDERLWSSTSHDEQREIKSTAREFLASPLQAGEGARARRVRQPVRRRDSGREMCELGWPGIAIAEEHGGQGLGVVELVILLEELGYALRAQPVDLQRLRRRA